MEFQINKSIARVNYPKNISMFKALGVNQTVCSTEVIANLIEYEFDSDICKIVQTFDRGAMILVEVSVDEKSRWLNCFIRDLELPGESVIAAVLRNGKIIYPRGDTQILKNDNVNLITNQATFLKIKKYMQNGGVSYAKQKK